MTADRRPTLSEQILAKPRLSMRRVDLRQSCFAALRSLCVLVVHWGALTASSASCSNAAKTCESGLCPSGFVCNPGNGLCEEAAKVSPTANGLLGQPAALTLPDNSLGVAAFDAEHQSLIWLRGDGESWQVTTVAGPLVSASELPTGQGVVAAIGADGRIHLAWRRTADGTLWYAVQGPDGWSREQVTAAAPGTVGAALALGLWQGHPVLAWRASDLQGIRVGRRVAAGWMVETLPAAVPLPGDVTAQSDVGRYLALAVLPTGPAIAAYDAINHGIVLALQSGEPTAAATTWKVSRLAGAEPDSPEPEGDFGAPLALTIGPGGDPVLVYRDRQHNRVFVARSKSGVFLRKVVLSGDRVEPSLQVERTDLMGTSLSVKVVPSGLVQVAALNGSTMRVHVAAEQSAGGYSTYIVPGGTAGWPALVTRADGSAVCLWLDLSDAAHRGLGHLRSWAVPRGTP